MNRTSEIKVSKGDRVYCQIVAVTHANDPGRVDSLGQPLHMQFRSTAGDMVTDVYETTFNVPCDGTVGLTGGLGEYRFALAKA